MNEQNTSLQNSLFVPYKSSFSSLGTGIDGVTGIVKSNPFSSIKQADGNTRNNSTHITFVSNESQFETYLDTQFDRSALIKGVTLSANSSIASELKFSDKTAVLIVEYQSLLEPPINTSETFELQDEFNQYVAQKNWNSLRSSFGDYYLANIVKGSLFRAIYRFSASSTSALVSFNQSFGASLPGLFDASFSASLKQAVRQNNLRLDLEIQELGANGTTPIKGISIDDVLELLQRFQENLNNDSGTPLMAQFKHYNTIIPDFPTTVGIPVSVLSDIQLLFRQYWRLKEKHDSLPSEYFQLEAFEKKYLDFENQIISNQSLLPHSSQVRTMLMTEADEVESWLDRARFWRELNLQVKMNPEPGTGRKHEIIETNNVYEWTYGLVSSNNANVKIDHTAQNYDVGSRVGHQEHDIRLVKSGSILVGYQVRALRPSDKNGSWWKNSGGIFSDSISIHAHSEYDRGTNRRLIAYWVSENDFHLFTSIRD